MTIQNPSGGTTITMLIHSMEQLHFLNLENVGSDLEGLKRQYFPPLGGSACEQAALPEPSALTTVKL